MTLSEFWKRIDKLHGKTADAKELLRSNGWFLLDSEGPFFRAQKAGPLGGVNPKTPIVRARTPPELVAAAQAFDAECAVELKAKSR